MSNRLIEILKATEFVSALCGAIVGGAIAVVGQYITIKSAEKSQARERLDIQKARGYSLLFKAVRTSSNLSKMSKMVDDMFLESQKRNPAERPWQFFMPLATSPDKVFFSADEMGLLLNLKEPLHSTT